MQDMNGAFYNGKGAPPPVLPDHYFMVVTQGLNDCSEYPGAKRETDNGETVKRTREVAIGNDDG